MGIQKLTSQQGVALQRQREAIARRYERRAQFDKALQQWRLLYKDDPDRQDYYDGVRQSLLALGRYEEAEALVRTRFDSAPSWVPAATILAEWGEVLLLAGDDEGARQKFELAIASDAGPGGYLAVSVILARNRRLDEAIEVLHRARRELHDETLFAYQLAPLLRQRMEWDQAAKEYLLALRDSETRPNVALRGLAAIPAEEMADDPVAMELREELDRVAREGEAWPGHREVLLRALADRSRNLGDFLSALPVISELDSLSRRPGMALVRFAGEAMEHGQDEAATRALRLAAERLDDPRGQLTVMFARADLAQRRGESALADSLFAQVIVESDSPELTQNALLRRGRLRLDVLGQAELGAADFRTLLRDPNPPMLHEARNGLASALASMDSLQEALDVLAEPLPGEPEGFATPVPSGDVEAGLLAARISLWQGKRELAANLLSWVLMPPKGEPLENDAFALLRLLTSADSTRLDSFAIADRAQFRGEIREAVRLYEQLAGGEDELASESGWRAGGLSLGLGDPAPLRGYAGKHENTPRGEEAWLKLALWHADREQYQDAVDAVESLLIANPQGLLTPIARLHRERWAAELAKRQAASATP